MDRYKSHSGDDDTIGLDAEFAPHPEPPWPERVRVMVERPAEGLLGYHEDLPRDGRGNGRPPASGSLVVADIASGLVSKAGGLQLLVREVAQIAIDRSRALARLRDALEHGDNNAALVAAAELAGVQNPTR
jgi:hypothetical protein